MEKLFLDYETGCGVDLKTHGRARYLASDDLYIQIASWAVDNGPVQTWTCRDGVPFPTGIFKNRQLYAFNALFERGVTRVCLGINIPLDRIVDIMALCGRYGVPQNLDAATRAICPDEAKDGAGKALINRFKSAVPDDCEGKYWEDYIRYNVQDVISARTLVSRLPADHLSEREHHIWKINAEINDRGLPIAVDEAQCIYDVTTRFLNEQNARLPELTGGKVTKITQVQRIKNFVNEACGREVLTSLGKEHLARLMASEEFSTLPDAVVTVLEMRADLGLSSIGKYQRILNMAYDGRMYDNSRYYGAHTGRITGMGFQLLNLPRASVPDPDAEIGAFFDGSICERNPVKSARALIRPMIKAGSGKTLVCADWSSIEYALLIWLAGDATAVERFRDKYSPYKDMASTIYGVAYEDVTKEQRQTGKVGILGCGYCMGTQTFVAYSQQFGLIITPGQAERIIASFRRKYSKVVKLWYDLTNAAKFAILNPRREFSACGILFRFISDRAGGKWLRVELPSGRAMFYRDARVEDGKFGTVMTYLGIDQKTKTYSRQFSSPGKLTENVIQAIGRDVLYHGKDMAQKAGFHIIGSIYDEIICEEDVHGPADGEHMLQDLIACMCTPPEWGPGMALLADGWTGSRYRK